MKISIKNRISWTTRWWKLRDHAVISFESIQECDGQTDGQTRRLSPRRAVA